LPQKKPEQPPPCSLKKLMTLPMVERRTPRRPNTVLYSRMISSVRSQMNVPFSDQSRSIVALELWDAMSPGLRLQFLRPGLMYRPRL
jgi:hypothetical protein